MSDKPSILVERARTHNLKGIDCRVPHQAVTVVTGPSGAGKSSLAFDTIFAEGQRRFVESMSTYARQFLNQMERPPVDSISNVLPAVALEAKNAVKNARSTWTITETLDVLRLLYTHLGEAGCPRGRGPARASLPKRRPASRPRQRRRELHAGGPPAAAEEGSRRGAGGADPPGIPAPVQGRRGGAYGAGREVAGEARSLPLVLVRFTAKPETASASWTPWSRDTG